MSDSQLYGEDLHFADQLLERLAEFQKREKSHPEDALVLEPSSGWHRYIVHQAVQIFPSLSSFSVGEGSKRRSVICFSSKFNNACNSEDKDEKRRHRPLYRPPASRTSRESNSQKDDPPQKPKKSMDERLQAQLESRLKLFEEAELEERVPELNPHAPTFVPISSPFELPSVNFLPQSQLNNGTNGFANFFPTPVSPIPGPIDNGVSSQVLTPPILTSPEPFNPDATPFIPNPLTNGLNQMNLFEQIGALPELAKPVTNLSKFIDTYQEFVPSSKIAKGSKKSPKRSPDRDPKPKKNEKATRKEAYVPPPLRAKTAKEEKPLTTDQIDRIRNSEKKEKAMIERAKSQEADASQKKSAYNSFKNQKPKSRNRRNSEGRFDLRDNDSRETVHFSDEENSFSEEDIETIDWADDQLDQNVLDEISNAVPGLKIKRSYDIVIPSHMLEIYDFPKAVRTQDLLQVFSNQYSGFSVRWVDDTHALAIFASRNQREQALEVGGCGNFRVRDLANASEESRKKASLVAREQRNEIDLEPAIRPETSTVVARRLIAANVDSKIAKQIRAAVEEEAIIKGKVSPVKDEKPVRRRSKGKGRKSHS